VAALKNGEMVDFAAFGEGWHGDDFRRKTIAEWHLLKIDTPYGVDYKRVTQCVVLFVVKPVRAVS